MSYANQGMADGDRGCGARLRKARESAGLTQHDVAVRLKVPVHVVDALEREDWSRLGAPVFVRGQLRSYSRLLGLTTSTTLEAARIGPVEPPVLVSYTHTPRLQRLWEQGSRRLVYILLTAAIAVPVWLATRPHLGGSDGVRVQPLDMLPPPAAPALGQRPAAEAAAPLPETVIASIAPVDQRFAPMPAPALSLRFHGKSWFQATGTDGSVLEQALLSAGDTRQYAAGEVAHIVLGNAAVVTVQSGGRTADLAPYRRANVARFTVSSDGSLAPAD